MPTVREEAAGRVHTKQQAHRRPDLQDTLSSLSDRTDLERLFDRKVGMSQILRLAGKGIRRQTILALLDGPDPAGALRKLLGS